MTYRELAAEILAMSEDEKDMDVTVHVFEFDEFFPAHINYSVGSDVLDDGHPYISNCGSERSIH